MQGFVLFGLYWDSSLLEFRPDLSLSLEPARVAPRELFVCSLLSLNVVIWWLPYLDAKGFINVLDPRYISWIPDTSFSIPDPGSNLNRKKRGKLKELSNLFCSHKYFKIYIPGLLFNFFNRCRNIFESVDKEFMFLNQQIDLPVTLRKYGLPVDPGSV